MKWDPPDTPNGIITRYILYGNNSYKRVLPSNVTMVTVTGLEPNTAYTFRVAVCTIIGCRNSTESRPISTLEDGKLLVTWCVLHQITLCLVQHDTVWCTVKVVEN